VDAATLGAIASVITALGILINAVVTALSLMQGRSNAKSIKSVDDRVDGHLSALTAMISTVDPSIAAKAAADVLKTAQDLTKPPS
jgi:uncharacterized protein YaaN involved in tellurite resistance